MDRITNLQPPPSMEQEEKDEIPKRSKGNTTELQDGNEFLVKRLKESINEYEQFINQK